jgi:hypothetical protein
MVRFLNLIMALALSTGVAGCSHSHGFIFHCDACDDFPTPGYGPGYSMMPGTYTGPPARDVPEPSQSAASAPGPGTAPATSGTVPQQGAPGGSTPPPAPAVPGPRADMR